jgi:hypothetical protein
MPAVLDALLPRRMRTVIAGIWLLGAGIAGITTPFAVVGLGAGAGLPFAAVAVVLVALAVVTHRGLRWALASSLALLGSQLFAIAGSAIELWLGVGGSKAAELRSLGVEPAFGVLVNLIYSTISFGMFCWVLIAFALRRARRGSS